MRQARVRGEEAAGVYSGGSLLWASMVRSGYQAAIPRESGDWLQPRSGVGGYNMEEGSGMVQKCHEGEARGRGARRWAVSSHHGRRRTSGARRRPRERAVVAGAVHMLQPSQTSDAPME